MKIYKKNVSEKATKDGAIKKIMTSLLDKVHKRSNDIHDYDANDDVQDQDYQGSYLE